MPVGDSSEGWGWEDAWGDAGGRGGEDAGRMFSGQCPGVVRGGLDDCSEVCRGYSGMHEELAEAVQGGCRALSGVGGVPEGM